MTDSIVIFLCLLYSVHNASQADTVSVTACNIITWYFDIKYNFTSPNICFVSHYVNISRMLELRQDRSWQYCLLLRNVGVLSTKPNPQQQQHSAFTSEWRLDSVWNFSVLIFLKQFYIMTTPPCPNLYFWKPLRFEVTSLLCLEAVRVKPESVSQAPPRNL